MLPRVRDLQRDCADLDVFAVDIDKLTLAFDEPFSPEQRNAIRNGG
jgi:hypothetical protein